MMQTLSVISLVIFSFVTILFIISLMIKRNDIADIAWGPGIFLVALTAYISNPLNSTVLNIMLLLIFVWAARLSIRIFSRNIKKTEDYRYKQWREEWGKWFYIRSYMQVYLLQGFLMIVVGYSFVHASIYLVGSSLGLVSLAGVLVWAVGFYFESVGDWQLDRFIKNKPQQREILKTGLWKYTRHPNYFGEVTMWWGIWLVTAGVPMSYIALVSPLAITFLILKVSGIPMLEKKFEGNLAFEEYKKKTSAFFPLPKKTK